MTNEVTHMTFKGENIVKASIETQNMIESVLNSIGEDTSNYAIEVFIGKSQRETFSNSVSKYGSKRWTKCGKQPLTHKSKHGKKVVLYNMDTNFWIMVNNRDTPKELKKFLKDNPDMFTHCISLETENISTSRLKHDFQAIHTRHASSKINKRFEELQATVYEIESFKKAL